MTTQNKTVVLAFSGGLDTSYCVPALIEQGYRVVTLYVDTGGTMSQQRSAIRERAIALGASEHVEEDASGELWDEFVVPFVMGGVPYMDQYPLLCSDRYAIASRSARLARRLGTTLVAHGCTAMGNDQVRFDLALTALGMKILAPIRDLQGTSDQPRQYEMDYLQRRGFDTPAASKRYTMNENILGATISGSEIDQWCPPGEGTYKLCAPPDKRPGTPLIVRIGFEHGRALSLDGQTLPGAEILRRLNELLGAYGVGRGIYTGDTVVGLKGRIVFECPGITGLLTAHRALEHATLSQHQNAFKPLAARRWSELVFSGFFFEPLRLDLEALIRSSQRVVSGEVTLEASAGSVLAVAVQSPHILRRSGASYAQGADWSAQEAQGFIKLYGQSAAISTAINPAPDQKEHLCSTW